MLSFSYSFVIFSLFFNGVICELYDNPYNLPTAIGSNEVSLLTCKGRPNGFYIDQSLEAICGPRIVQCHSNSIVNEKYASVDQIYVPTNSGRGYQLLSLQTNANEINSICGISVDCSKDAIAITISKQQIWNQTAAQLQLNDKSCNCSFQNDKCELSSSLDGCGITKKIVDGDSVIFSTNVKRHTDRTEAQSYVEEHGVKVTREKCFMVTAICYFAASGKVTGSFQTTASQQLSTEDTANVNFVMQLQTDWDTPISTLVIVYTNTYIYIHIDFSSKEIHSDVRIHLVSVWATQTSDPNGGNKYYLLQDGCVKDSTYQDETAVGEETDNTGSYVEARFRSFRYFNDRENYVQEIWLHARVVVCSHNDTTSDLCKSGCSRRRRAISDASVVSTMTESVVSQHFVLRPAENKLAQPWFSSNLMFAVGGILATVAITLAILSFKRKPTYRVIEVE